MQQKEQILYLGFNQDQGCFSCGTESGFKIYNTYPFKETYSCELQGGIGQVEMLYRSNILALVGGGNQPKYQQSKLMLWDDHRVKCIGEMSFRTDVKSVRLKADRIVVVLENKIFVYNFSDLKLLEHIETCPNPQGLCSINTEGDQSILACPAKEVGWVSVSLWAEQKAQDIRAHQSALNCIQLSASGHLLATASQKGTVIRIYNPHNAQLLQELRRGSEYAQIYSIAFQNSGQFLACSSDSGTIHIFCLKGDQKSGEKKNPKSKFSIFKSIIPYFDSEWSFAQFRVVDNQTKVAFGPDPNSIIVVSYEGNYYKANFDPVNGGECSKELEERIIKDEQ